MSEKRGRKPREIIFDRMKMYELLAKNGLNGRGLAKELNISVPTIAKALGEKKIGIETAAKIAVFFGCSIRELLLED